MVAWPGKVAVLGSSMEMEPGTILNEHLRFQARACLPQGKAPGNTGRLERQKMVGAMVAVCVQLAMGDIVVGNLC